MSRLPGDPVAPADKEEGCASRETPLRLLPQRRSGFRPFNKTPNIHGSPGGSLKPGSYGSGCAT